MHKRSRIYAYSLAVAVLVVGIIAFLYPTEKTDTGYCTSDSDCVPAQCCHPTSAVNRQRAPDCSAVSCTAECRPGTLDCGQGRVLCINNRCAAEIFA